MANENSPAVKISLKSLTELSDVDVIKNEDFPDVFVENQGFIFQYARNDVLQALEPRDITVLSSVRNKLNEIIQAQFVEYADKTIKNRTVKHTILGDIITLGTCVVNDQSNKDLEKVYKEKSPIPIPKGSDTDTEEEQLRGSDLAGLIEIIIKLRNTVKKLESDLKTIKTEMKSEVLQIPSTSQVLQTPSTSRIENQTLDRSRTTDADSSSESEANSDRESGFKQVRKKNKSKGKKRGKNQPESQETTLVPQSLRSADDLKENRPKGDDTIPRVTDLKAAHVEESDPGGTKPVYVGNVHLECTEHSIYSHLRSQDVKLKPSDVTHLATRNGKKSYRVDVPQNQETRLLTKDSTCWPKGLKVRPFHPSPKQFGNNTRYGRHQKSSQKGQGKLPFRNRNNFTGWSRPYMHTNRDNRKSYPNYTRDNEWPPLPQRSRREPNNWYKEDWYADSHHSNSGYYDQYEYESHQSDWFDDQRYQ